LFHFAREAAGAAGARHSLRPLNSESGTFPENSRERRGEIAKLCLSFRRHCEERSDEAIHSSILLRAWIASRSPSSGAHSRDPLARNDGFEGCLKLNSAVIVRESGRSSIPERCD
jgi:hypothetical protein